MMRVETKFELSDSWLKENALRPPFSQSFEWEEVLSREGKEVERLTVVDNDEPVAMALVEYHKLPFGWRYAFCPKGPVAVKNLESGIWNLAVESLAEYLGDRKCIFFRFEPRSVVQIQNSKFKIQKIADINPRATMILNLRRTPDELLAGMHPKTRYNINLAQKKDLRLSDQKNADLFMELMKETGRRDKFRLHETRHYHEIIFSPLAHQLTVFSGTRPVATAVFTGFGDSFTYLFGASDYESRSLMAPHLIQWEGIKLGQRYGYANYDFFGVAPRQLAISNEQFPPKADQPLAGAMNDRQSIADYEYDPKHQYAGVTRFKQGFGGEYREDPGTFDLIISPKKYRVYGWLRAIRRFL